MLRHIELLPGENGASDALTGFVAAARPWSERAVVLSRRTAVALWMLAGTGLGVCVALYGLLPSLRSCDALACSVATFGGRPVLALALAVAGTTGLLVGALLTRGFTRVGARGLWQVVPAAVVTAASVVGPLVVLAVTVLLVIAGAVAIGILIAIVADRS